MRDMYDLTVEVEVADYGVRRNEATPKLASASTDLDSCRRKTSHVDPRIAGRAADDEAGSGSQGTRTAAAKPLDHAPQIDCPPAMLRVLRGLWRVIATGLAFVVFNVGCLVFGVPAVVLARMSTGSDEARTRRVQRLFQTAFRSFVVLLRVLGLIRLDLRNIEELKSRKGCLVVANHPTLLDVVYLIALMRSVDCVVKSDLSQNLFTRACVAGAGYIPNDSGAQMIDECVARLSRGHNVLLFPEGTRSPAAGLRPFQRGAARIALKSGCDILPVVITCRPPMLMKGMSWYHVPERTPRLTLTVGDPLSAVHLTDVRRATPAAVRQLTAELESHYQRQLGYG